MPRPPATAFTLVELLVVVAIIVVLISLLAPAMDRALYAADLAACGARLKAMAQGVTVYAAEHKRHYPDRPWVQASAWRPNWLWYKLTATHYDERKLIRPYVASINKQVQCPLVTELELDQLGETPGVNESNAAYCSYQLWYSWGYRGLSAMNRIGDQFTWNGRAFGILASDYDLVSLPQDDNFTVGSHPDQGADPRMFEQVWNNKSYAAEAVGIGLPGTVIIYSRWASGFRRGPVDLNFAYADGAVGRLDRVIVADAGDDTVPDERMARVPEMSDNSTPKWVDHLPPER